MRTRTLGLAAAAGAAVMFFFDPQHGRRRRRMLLVGTNGSGRERSESLGAITLEGVIDATPELARRVSEQLPRGSEKERIALPGTGFHRDLQIDRDRTMIALGGGGKAGKQAEKPAARSGVGGRPGLALLGVVAVVAAPVVAAFVGLAIVGSPSSSSTPTKRPASQAVARERVPKAVVLAQTAQRRQPATVKRQDSKTTRSAPLLTWTADPRATGYWVDVARVHAGRENVLLTLLTATPSLAIPDTWYNHGRRSSLTSGRYRWYVWPRYSSASGSRRGKLLARGEFIVAAPRSHRGASGEARGARATHVATVSGQIARVVITASRGPCWLLARAGSSTGRVLYQGELARGQAIRLAARRIFLRFGAATNVDMILNGQPIKHALSGTVVEAMLTSGGLSRP